MKAFLWYRCKEVSNKIPSEGSVIIEAETLERAREIGVFEGKVEFPLEPDRRGLYGGYLTVIRGKTGSRPIQIKMDLEREPDRIFESDAKEEKVSVFENRGCC